MNADTATELIELALAQHRLWDGGLVRSAGKSEGSETAWYFTTALTIDVLEHFRTESASAIITSDAIGIGPRFTFWVVAIQTGAIQHRFFLPLVGTLVAELLADMRGKNLRLLMAAGTSVAAVDVRVPVSPQLRAALESKHQLAADRESVLPDVVLTAARLLAPDGLRPDNPGNKPTSISVTAVLPPELLGHADGFFGA
ncbi:hypothetical protein GCM10028796_25190 [Ramlibacter monticola]|uniref:Uncharacterized protein n=1 Tax=Ramlibacter monticola TaxID=1926872 RepID=A0A937CV89_9BURK|nr:hypothetical protein [Ramlibacter monticola]MBL0392762.1 hypothetical protein [Ramlibacter monticola]